MKCLRRERSPRRRVGVSAVSLSLSDLMARGSSFAFGLLAVGSDDLIIAAIAAIVTAVVAAGI